MKNAPASDPLLQPQPPHLSDENFERFSRLAESRFGLSFTEKRRMELERGVLQAFAASTCASLEAFYQQLLHPSDGAVQLERLANALTIGETHFFRDEYQFDALERQVLPQLIERRRALRALRIWSAGCSSGEEAYSIAILLRELLPDVDNWSITILATDVNTQALDKARRALYSEWAFREERARLRRPRYFEQADGAYALDPRVRRMVTFAQLNLAQDIYPSYDTNTTLMDLILCRNVTIYFPLAVTQRVIEKLYEAQAEGGWLVVGHSEPSLETYRRYQVRNFPGAILYQRVSQPGMDWLPPLAAPGQAALLGTNTLAAQAALVLPQPVQPATPAPEPAAEPTQPAAASAAQAADPLARAQELLASGQSAQAGELLAAFLQGQPNHLNALILLGQACANQGRWEEAERCCCQALQQNTLARDAYYTLALVQQHQGRLEQATELMKKVVYIDRKDVLGHFGLADLYHSRRQGPLALKALENALRLLEGRPEVEVIPDSGGITVGHLRGVLVSQQQRWSAEMTAPGGAQNTGLREA